jgi:hypothetical protein
MIAHLTQLKKGQLPEMAAALFVLIGNFAILYLVLGSTNLVLAVVFYP